MKTTPLYALQPSDPYRLFRDRISGFIPAHRIFTDLLRRIAYGTDASFYRLVPEIVVWVEGADDVSRLLVIADAMGLAVVFRAAGTSLSGQAITDSILVVTSRDWQGMALSDDHDRVTLAPSVVGAQANAYLLPYGKKIGPDPASIATAMIGGIAANNASGMCCGVADNSYKTLHSLKVILQDGTRLDTADPESIARFRQTHGALLGRLGDLGAQTRANAPLRERIAHKFKIKNTTGYSLNALIDYTDPIDILAHLMIGSEGTLGFLEEITYRTVTEYPHKASALMLFGTIRDACDAVIVMKQRCAEVVDAAEIMDRAALRSVEDQEGMPTVLRTLPDDAAAVLVETSAPVPESLHARIEQITAELEGFEPIEPIVFTDDRQEYGRYWQIRKGLFPAVGAVREVGTTVIIEDVAYPIAHLADATLELQRLFVKYGYDEAIIFGHALEGNLHFVFTQAFDDPAEVDRYARFMDEVAHQVTATYGGSLKAEHGTGRNMAPFVEMEWGAEAYALMQEIKAIFDPRGLLNPGVILNDDRRIHLKHFKTMPPTHPLIDACTECGFCEPTCPSNALTLTPRQRIVAHRTMTAMAEEGEVDALSQVRASYRYDGIETCATCQLCSIACPVGIDTGHLTKQLRAEAIGQAGHWAAGWMADHYGGVLQSGRRLLSAVRSVTSRLPERATHQVAHRLHTASGGRIPQWTPALPSGERRGVEAVFGARTEGVRLDGMLDEKVVYFSSCINRTMTNPHPQPDEMSIAEVVQVLLERAGYEVVIPASTGSLCCGMPWGSKGYTQEAQHKSDELEAALRIASENGRYPILSDMSPCTKTMHQQFGDDLRVYDSVAFITRFLLDRLPITPTDEPVVIHTTCSTRKMGEADQLEAIARRCSTRVTIPTQVSCCGFAGDRGFTYPELNRSALRHLRSAIPPETTWAFSTSKTCEIGLSEHSGLDYRSIFYLLERCTRDAKSVQRVSATSQNSG
jgi:D-lactate dehydrogenase